MVERCVRDAEVASSNLVTSTIFLSNRIFMRFVCLLPVSSLPCRYRLPACRQQAFLRAWARPSAPLRERASSPLREFSFRFRLLYLAFFDFGYKNTAPFGAVKLLSLVVFAPNFTKKRLFLQSLCSSQVQLIAQGYNKTAHCCGRFYEFIFSSQSFRVSSSQSSSIVS